MSDAGLGALLGIAISVGFIGFLAWIQWYLGLDERRGWWDWIIPRRG